jgi:plastocyanin
MKMRSALLAVLTVVLVAGCGGGDNKTSPTPSTVPGAGAAAGTVVDIVTSGASWRFDPATETTTVGGSVTWTNSTDVPHNVVFADPAVTSSELFAKGKSFTTAFSKAGTFTYVCSVHPDMKGTIVAQ